MCLKTWLRRHYESSLPQQQQTLRLDQQATLGRMDSSSSLLLSPWFKLANSMEKLMKMQCTLTTLPRDLHHLHDQKSTKDAILLRLFPFSLLGKAKQ